MSPSTRPPLSARRQQQSGVVLIVALVMLVIIGLASAAIMRNALSSDTISDNNRRQAHALQAAQAALRYCEGLVQNSSTRATTAVAAAASEDTEDWNTFANWQKVAPTTGAPKTVPASFLTSSSTVSPMTKMPQCMAQARSLTNVYVITARGFSENYQADDSGRTQSGAVVWLQSIIKLQS